MVDTLTSWFGKLTSTDSALCHAVCSVRGGGQGISGCRCLCGRSQDTWLWHVEVGLQVSHMHLQAFSVPAVSVRCLVVMPLLCIFALAFAFSLDRAKKTTPFSVNLMRSPVLCRGAQTFHFAIALDFSFDLAFVFAVARPFRNQCFLNVPRQKHLGALDLTFEAKYYTQITIWIHPLPFTNATLLRKPKAF